MVLSVPWLPPNRFLTSGLLDGRRVPRSASRETGVTHDQHEHEDEEQCRVADVEGLALAEALGDEQVEQRRCHDGHRQRQASFTLPMSLALVGHDGYPARALSMAATTVGKK